MNISQLCFMLSGMVVLSISACSSTPLKSSLHTLQQVKNIEAYPESQTNQATLSKASDHCIIQFTGYFSGGESTETWQFYNNKLIQASSKTTHYALPDRQPDNRSQQEVSGQNHISTVTFNTQDIDVKNNFNKLSSHFSQQALAQCGSDQSP